MGKSRASQFEIMIEFMERHGDLQNPATQDRLENLKKWHELVDLLNNNTTEEPKPLEKWRKAWSDYKNNTKKKVMKISQHGGVGPAVTQLEQRVLQLIGFNKKNDVAALDESDSQFKFEVNSDSGRSSQSPSQRNFVSVDGHTSRRHRTSSTTSSSSSSSSEPILSARKKRKKSDVSPDGVKEMTDKFLDYEREKEKMAHEQEMARIKQNDQLLSILGRMANVLEALAPSIQRST